MALQQSPASASSSTGKDPVSYERLRESFMRELHHFHDTRGTTFKKCPKVNGKEVDLYKLYTLVTSRGGWIQHTKKFDSYKKKKIENQYRIVSRVIYPEGKAYKMFIVS